ncbi:MAG: response regulator transcription factor [Acetatifactor sp.]|nr:response regulator transcription factor [Acetatifactor sp.]
MSNIMVIDDDIYIGNLLEEVLLGQGYGVSRAYSGTEALLLLKERKPDLILLDLMLPGINGEEVLAQITGIPVIVVSAKADVEDKVKLLFGGAADYITKPFDTKELLARVAVQLRNKKAPAGDVLIFGDLVMDTREYSVTASGERIRLTRTEYAILKLLMQNPSQVITRSVLLERISYDTPDGGESSLKVHISNLRKKLKQPTGRDYIEAVWGIGFKLRDPKE